MAGPINAVEVVVDEETGTVEERPVALPPAVYVPCESYVEGESVDVAFRRTNDGRLALLAYTALDRLVACCGEHQPWFLMPSDRLAALHELFTHDVVFVDLWVPEEERIASPQ